MDSNQTEAAQVSTPNQSSGAPVPPTNANRKSKGPVIGMIACAILAVAGISFGVYSLIQANEKSKELANLKVQIENQDGSVAALEADEVVVSDDEKTITISDPMKNDTNVRKIVDIMQEVATETSGVGNIKSYDVDFPLVKNQNAKTLLRLEKSYGLYAFKELDDMDKSLEIAEAINKKLKENGFVENGDVSGPSYVVGDSNLINHDSGIVCNINSGLPFIAGCGHTSWISNDTISLANKLADAFFAVENTYPFSINFDHYAIKDSPISPYQILINVAVSNAKGLFYRTGPDADWQYFTTTQGVLNCSDFNTQDLKNAFAGETCYDGSQNSTVQP